MAVIPCLYWPVTVATSGMVLRLAYSRADTTAVPAFNTTVTAGTYYIPGGSG
jgi:hypothetical protein